VVENLQSANYDIEWIFISGGSSAKVSGKA
jgi:hypothetical protein